MTTKEFEKFYNENRNTIFNYVKWKIVNHQEAEDLTSKIFIKAHKLIFTDEKEHRFNPKKSDIKTWVYNIAKCAIIDYSRTDLKHKPKLMTDFVNSDGDEVIQFVASKTENPDFNINNNVLKERIKEAFINLNDNEKRIAELYFLEENKYAKIAEMLNIPLGTVKGTINRSKKHLQKALKDLYSTSKYVHEYVGT